MIGALLQSMTHQHKNTNKRPRIDNADTANFEYSTNSRLINSIDVDCIICDIGAY